MNYDKISKAYIETVVEAVALGDQIPDLEISSDARKKLYHKQKSEGFHTLSQIDDKLTLMVKRDIEETKYAAVDKNSKEAHYKSTFLHRKPTKEIPFEHHIQDEVAKNHNSSLPKKFASNLALDHVAETGIPLVSSDYQMFPGHRMWQNIINDGIKRGFHAYRTKNGKFRKIETEGHDDTYDYYHDTKEGLHDHLIISKKEL